MCNKHKTGDEIQVSNDGINWHSRIFLTELNGKYLCVQQGLEEAYEKGKSYTVLAWNKAIRYDTPITFDEAVILLTDSKDNKVRTDDGYTYQGYEGIGIMCSKRVLGDTTTKYYRVKQ